MTKEENLNEYEKRRTKQQEVAKDPGQRFGRPAAKRCQKKWEPVSH